MIEQIQLQIVTQLNVYIIWALCHTCQLYNIHMYVYVMWIELHQVGSMHKTNNNVL